MRRRTEPRIWRAQSDLLKDWRREKQAFSFFFFELLSLICVCVFSGAKVNRIGPSDAVGSSTGDLKRGESVERLWLREETRGALAPLWVSMAAAVVPLFLFRRLSLISLFFFWLSDSVLSSRPSNRLPPRHQNPDVYSAGKSEAVVDMKKKKKNLTVFPVVLYCRK